MKQRVVGALVVLLGLSTAACRQADGPLPPATGEVPNQLVDISRDILNIASGSPDALADLSHDLSHYAEETPTGVPAANELSRRISVALGGKTFTADEALPLARSCWLAVAGRQLSEMQIENLQAEIKSQLMALGADEEQAQDASTQAGVVQQAVTMRHRRWYELL